MCGKRLLPGNYRRSLLCVALLTCLGALDCARRCGTAGPRRTGPPHPAALLSLVRQSRPRVDREEYGLRLPGLGGPASAGLAGPGRRLGPALHQGSRGSGGEDYSGEDPPVAGRLPARRPAGDPPPSPPQAKSQPGWVGRGEKRGLAAEPARGVAVGRQWRFARARRPAVQVALARWACQPARPLWTLMRLAAAAVPSQDRAIPRIRPARGADGRGAA